MPVFLQGITVEMAVVETESAADVEPFGNVFCCRGKDAEVEEMIGGNEELMAKVLRLLPHTVDSGIHGPSVPCRRHIAEIVVDGVKAEVLSHFVGGFIFLTAVLLVGQQSLDAAFANVEAVVKRHLVVAYMLEGGFVLMLVFVALFLMLVVMVCIMVFFFFMLVICIMLMMVFSHDARFDMIVGQFQVAVAPVLVESHHHARSLFGELRVFHLVVNAVLVFAGSFLTPASVPDESLLIARKVDGVVPEVGIRLPSAAHGGLHRAEGLDGGIVENNDAGHGIRAVHQRGGAFHDFYGMNAFAIHFHTMLIAPLLAFLTDAVVNH